MNMWYGDGSNNNGSSGNEVGIDLCFFCFCVRDRDCMWLSC
uniref:Uncharacterized protein n=1 Tax=Spodoptera exigua multiple nucleopolyhedrovirus TaxID=10454 RepID=A0A6N0C2D9_9ABAC|nr:hypothetical protein [Spodoptera exigua multiple nucleopolyhedrovirus]